MNKTFYFLISTSLFLSLWLNTVQARAALTAHLDRSQVTEGETVRLTIEAAGQVSSMPDTRALNQDFEVAGTMSSSRVNLVNGKMDARTTWTLSLIPLRSGQLTIPPLNINGEYTPELTLHVTEASTGTGSDGNTPIFLETEVDKTDPYVQGKVRYTQRVFLAVNLAQGSLSEPEHENALVQKLGEDREYVTQRNGRSYTVIERQFAIFPQTSGLMVIPAPVLNAQIPQSSNRHDPFFDRLFTNTRPVRLRGEAVTLDVRPRPGQSQSPYWLPAESVTLQETWQPENDTINFGDPVTRTITLKALGVTGEQLPEPKLADPAGFKLYPDRAQSVTQNLPDNIQGEKTLRLAYMPTQPGKYTLPAFSIHWWDTATDSARIATLPERTIEVLPGASQPHGALTPAPDLTGPIETDMPHARQGAPAAPFFQPGLSATDTAGSSTRHTGWFWAALLFAALWLITLGFLWRTRRHPLRPATAIETTPGDPQNARDARKRFLAACRDNNPQQARYYLLKWAAAHWPDSPPKGLDELAMRLDDTHARAALKQLDRILYRHPNENWDSSELSKRVVDLPKHGRKSKSTSGRNALPGLYS
ncbi:MAG: protein BatD [Nitrosomonas sp.]|nr:protein BatD [Nitrosomonas sp.]MCW5607592.1 protein BatD [Nitrosomonas sp.]